MWCCVVFRCVVVALCFVESLVGLALLFRFIVSGLGVVVFV